MKNHAQPYCRNFLNRYWRSLVQDQTAPFRCQALQESLLAQLYVVDDKQVSLCPLCRTGESP